MTTPTPPAPETWRPDALGLKNLLDDRRLVIPGPLCPGCERLNCGLWTQHRRRLRERKDTAKSLLFGLTFTTEPNRNYRP